MVAPMQTVNTTKLLGGMLVVGIILVAVAWYMYLKPAKPPPNAPGYYTGPLRAKGNPNIAATDDGQKVNLPPPASTEAGSK